MKVGQSSGDNGLKCGLASLDKATVVAECDLNVGQGNTDRSRLPNRNRSIC